MAEVSIPLSLLLLFLSTSSLSSFLDFGRGLDRQMCSKLKYHPLRLLSDNMTSLYSACKVGSTYSVIRIAIPYSNRSKWIKSVGHLTLVCYFSYSEDFSPNKHLWIPFEKVYLRFKPGWEATLYTLRRILARFQTDVNFHARESLRKMFVSVPADAETLLNICIKSITHTTHLLPIRNASITFLPSSLIPTFVFSLCPSH